MREVAVLGIGQTRVDEHWDKSLKELAGDAILAALQDSGLAGAECLVRGQHDVGSRQPPAASGCVYRGLGRHALYQRHAY